MCAHAYTQYTLFTLVLAGTYRKIFSTSNHIMVKPSSKYNFPSCPGARLAVWMKMGRPLSIGEKSKTPKSKKVNIHRVKSPGIVKKKTTAKSKTKPAPKTATPQQPRGQSQSCHQCRQSIHSSKGVSEVKQGKERLKCSRCTRFW